MSTADAPDATNAAVAELGSAAAAKPQRVLACLLCQQRKIKCNRQFPCSNCTRTGAHCVPASLVPRQRRRRFPERELLDRIRHYEALLRQHGVSFEPLHPPPAAAGAAPTAAVAGAAAAAEALSAPLGDAGNDDDGDDDDDDEAVDAGYLHDGDDLRAAVIKKAWDYTYRSATESNQQLLFGSPASASDVELTAAHPPQAKIFRLWQIYLDNVNPLLKVTHTPTLQARIIDAVGDLANISAPLEALLFSIYCVAVLSLPDDQCQAVFGSPKQALLAGYQLACRQALSKCRFLQSGDPDCLTALYLYLISVRSMMDPRSLSSMSAVAIRIAQRLGYHSEASNAKCNALDAEMRRRLWWSLVIFDNRVCEIFHYKTATLSPTWDCRPPLNLNDFELRAETKSLPQVSERPTEAFFVVLRSELSDFVRHSAFHLDFIDPLLTSFAQTKMATRGSGSSPPTPRDLAELQRNVEERLRLCDPQNPLQFMTIWTARGYLARCFLLEHCWKHLTSSPSQQADGHSAAAVGYALSVVQCDTRLMTSPLTKGFLWYHESFFPFLGYTYLLQRLRKRPADEQADLAWEVMSDNYEARNMTAKFSYMEPIFVVFARLVMMAWEARQSMLRQHGRPAEPPRIVAYVKHKIQGSTDMTLISGATSALNLAEPSTSMPVGIGANTAAATAAAAGPSFAAPVPPCGYPDAPVGQAAMISPMAMDMDPFWPAMDWGLVPNRQW
ncbi:uncharacterized protein THITE_2053454 [Thermothielavioides terrestris NRRL 8126]|uniref:Zn(2)-C6 fungal-type domain-containing protein n=1 Tax=Thermothielavioides terrestris (strain ATCC 38088 / NRRL 8126) TaxID=578455 RepID=G2RAH2_THETT|nr:uncharacterized protein THITE_2053454 [Thermothielavioides terrestris NRRL 8126]AEO69707.1 hypothetical protein THITE_2053454 [Thermothielavioides terrestris NRRL 8126]